MATSQVPDTSTTLLRDVADSQHARWAVFYSRYQPMMRSYLRARFPAVDADDVIQETFAALVKLLPDYKYDPKKKGSFHNFLTGVLRNKALCALDLRNRKMSIEDRMKIKVTVDGNPFGSRPMRIGARRFSRWLFSSFCPTARFTTVQSRRSSVLRSGGSPRTRWPNRLAFRETP